MGVVDGLDAAPRGDVVLGRRQLEVGVVAQRAGRLHEPLAETLLSDEHRAVEVLQRTRYNLGGRGRVAVDEHRQRQLRKDGLRLRAVALLLGAAVRGDHLGPLGDEHRENLHRLLHDAAAVAAVVEHQPPQVALRTQPFDGRAHLLVAPVGEVAVLDVANRVVEPAGVGDGRDGNPLAAERHLLAAAVEQPLDGDPYRRAGGALEPCAHLVGGEAAGILAVDGHNAVADFQPGAVGRRILVGLSDDDVVALLADEGAHAAVLARGEQLEGGHLLLGHVLGIGVQVADHPLGGPLHQTVGVDLVDVVERQLAHHVDGDFDVAPQTEVVALAPEQRAEADDQDGRRGEHAQAVSLQDVSIHTCFVQCRSRAGRRRGPHRGGCPRGGPTVRTARRGFHPRPA